MSNLLYNNRPILTFSGILQSVFCSEEQESKYDQIPSKIVFLLSVFRLSCPHRFTFLNFSFAQIQSASRRIREGRVCRSVWTGNGWKIGKREKTLNLYTYSQNLRNLKFPILRYNMPIPKFSDAQITNLQSVLVSDEQERRYNLSATKITFGVHKFHGWRNLNHEQQTRHFHGVARARQRGRGRTVCFVYFQLTWVQSVTCNV